MNIYRFTLLTIFLTLLGSHYASAQPEITLDPEEYSITLAHGLKQSEVIDIFNDGDSSLTISANVVSPRRDENIDILVWTTWTDAEWELPRILASLENLTVDYTLSYYDGSDPEEIAERLEEVHVFLIPEQESGDSENLGSIGYDLWESIQNFVDTRGGTVVAADADGMIFEFLAESGLLQLDLGESGLTFMCERGTPHVLNVGIDEYTAQPGSNFHDCNNDDAIAVSRAIDYDGNHVTARKIGNGGVIYIGSDWWQYNSDMTRLLTNAISWSHGNWLSLDQIPNEIQSNDSESMFFSIDTRSTPGPGNYSLDIILSTNDPDNAVIRIPVDIQVTRWEPAELKLTPAEIFVISQSTQDCTIVVLVENVGGGLLEAELALYAESSWLDINRRSVSINPGLADRVVITIDPAEADNADNNVVTDFVQFHFSNLDADTLIELPVYYYKGDAFGSIDGITYDAGNQEPISDVNVNIHGLATISNQDGEFEYPRLPSFYYQVEFHHPDYLPYIANQIRVSSGSETMVNAPMTYCTFETDWDSDIVVTQLPNETSSFDITFSNNGTGDLNFSSRFVDKSVQRELVEWEERITFASGELTNRTDVYGAAFDGEHVYLSARSNTGSSKAIFRANRDGVIIDSLPQPGDNPYGTADFAWDGELMWGCGWGAIYGMNSDGEIVDTIQNRVFNYNRAIAYDPDHDLFWIANANSHLVAVDRNNRIVVRLDNPGISIYGLAWMQDDTAGYPLFAFCRNGPSSAQLNRINPETGEVLYLRDLPTQGNEEAGGIEITPDWDRRHWTLICQFVGSGNRTSFYTLQKMKSWVTLDQPAGNIEPDRSLNNSFYFNSLGMSYEEVLSGYFILDGGQRGGPDTLNVELISRENAIPHTDNTPLPGLFTLSLHPNPFNNRLIIDYSVPLGHEYAVRLYDLNGRLAQTLQLGKSDGVRRKATYNFSRLSTGVYFLKLETDTKTIVRKALLLK
ncbi:T9SS type A sorting domain-containing protein [Calditrichota bacterium]